MMHLYTSRVFPASLITVEDAREYIAGGEANGTIESLAHEDSGERIEWKSGPSTCESMQTVSCDAPKPVVLGFEYRPHTDVTILRAMGARQAG